MANRGEGFRLKAIDSISHPLFLCCNFCCLLREASPCHCRCERRLGRRHIQHLEYCTVRTLGTQVESQVESVIMEGFYPCDRLTSGAFSAAISLSFAVRAGELPRIGARSQLRRSCYSSFSFCTLIVIDLINDKSNNTTMCISNS